MAVFALRLRLAEGCGPRYDAAHRDVPPEIERALVQGGVRSMRIFRDGEELVMALELEHGLSPDDLAEAVPPTAADAGWEAVIDALQHSAGASGGWRAIPCVYELRARDGSLGAAGPANR